MWPSFINYSRGESDWWRTGKRCFCSRRQGWRSEFRWGGLANERQLVAVLGRSGGICQIIIFCLKPQGPLPPGSSQTDSAVLMVLLSMRSEEPRATERTKVSFSSFYIPSKKSSTSLGVRTSLNCILSQATKFTPWQGIQHKAKINCIVSSKGCGKSKQKKPKGGRESGF